MVKTDCQSSLAVVSDINNSVGIKIVTVKTNSTKVSRPELYSFVGNTHIHKNNQLHENYYVFN